jgi:hypothetical protein
MPILPDSSPAVGPPTSTRQDMDDTEHHAPDPSDTRSTSTVHSAQEPRPAIGPPKSIGGCLAVQRPVRPCAPTAASCLPSHAPRDSSRTLPPILDAACATVQCASLPGCPFASLDDCGCIRMNATVGFPSRGRTRRENEALDREMRHWKHNDGKCDSENESDGQRHSLTTC